MRGSRAKAIRRQARMENPQGFTKPFLRGGQRINPMRQAKKAIVRRLR